MDKNQIINQLIDEKGYSKYLEIGYGNGEGFKAIKCEEKFSIDPNGKADFQGTSDEFFEQANKKKKYHVILVDGLHHADQVRKDIINASKLLTKDGAIVLHDVNPNSKETQSVPCRTAIWEGNCWRAFIGFRKSYPDVETKCYLDDHGVAIIFPKGEKFEGEFEDMETTYEEFEANKADLLGVE